MKQSGSKDLKRTRVSGLLGKESQVRIEVRGEGGGLRRVVVCPLTTAAGGVKEKVLEEEGAGGEEVTVLVSWEKGGIGEGGLKGMVGKRGVLIRKMRDEEVVWLSLRGGKSALFLISKECWQKIW